MMIRTGTVILLALVFCGTISALEPDEILVIANNDSTESRRIARYYCSRRGVPEKNILALTLGANLNDTISRDNYKKQLAKPIRKRLLAPEILGKIRCLLTIYGVPIKVAGRGPLRNRQDRLKELKGLVEQEKKKIEQLKPKDSAKYKESKDRLAKLQLQIARINGKETDASVDSELSMVLFEDYDLYRWQPNKLKNDVLGLSFRTLMVSRLDGPGDRIAAGLVDKAVEAEKTGLKGVACIDSRGIMRNDIYGHFDQSLRDLATLTGLRTEMPVKEERTAKLFAPNSCPRTAIYCGWYSLKKYVDAFDFVNGAIGFHIASFEAVNLRDPNSSQWCPSMLRDGITATLGAVSEPYLHSFPEPRAFFAELYQGRCLVEAYYRTKPFNSWQLLLIGDPLYKPFEKH
ncbi:MAG: TIGR03790 family protein [Planctomycetota bacterium]|jgi:uncharacterized protein (TIGR03790 family)